MAFSVRKTALGAAAAFALCTGALLLVPASAPLAATQADTVVRTISVSGQGEIKGTPDEAHLFSGVVTHGRTAAEALAANSRAMNQVFATLKRLGIPDKNIQTSNFNISPQYSPYDSNHPEPPQRIVGYEVTNTVNVTMRGIANVGPAIDALVSSGVNQSSGIFFTIADPKPLEEKARRQAVVDAMAKARTLAGASGVRLGRVVSINESGGYVRPVAMIMHRAAMAPTAPTPVAAGEASVVVGVSIVYEIQ